MKIAFVPLSLAIVFSGCAGESKSPARPSALPVFILGFDGLDPHVVAQFERQGLLPNFARLRERAAVGNVRSTLPFISPPAWTSISTGTRPADHGIWSFWIPEGDNPQGRYVDATARLAPAIWEDLTRLGRRVGVVNVPISSPPDSVTGFMIAGMPFPKGARLTWPPELEAEIVARGYEREAFEGPPLPGEEEIWLDRIERIEIARRKIGLDLLFERRPDLSFIVFTATDRVQHHLWKFHDPKHPHYRSEASDRLKNAVRDVYVWSDEVLGEVLERLPPGTLLLVVSDHGFGPAYCGITKERFLADLPERQRSMRPTTRNLFGGDFYLESSTQQERQAFAALLEELSDGNGNRLVRAAYDVRQQENPGLGAELGPDVVALEAEGYMFVPGAPQDSLVANLPVTSFSGYHRREGYFAAFGPPVAPGPLSEFDLENVAGIAMHALGEALPRRYATNFPREIFRPEYLGERPLEFSGTPTEGLKGPGEARPSDAANLEIEEQLRALGYVNK